jgi:hypothetical protein
MIVGKKKERDEWKEWVANESSPSFSLPACLSVCLSGSRCLSVWTTLAPLI